MTQQYETPQRAMSIKEFTKAYGVSRSTAYNLMSSGQLKTIKVGTRRLIPVEAAQAWFASLSTV